MSATSAEDNITAVVLCCALPIEVPAPGRLGFVAPEGSTTPPHTSVIRVNLIPGINNQGEPTVSHVLPAEIFKKRTMAKLMQVQ